MVGRGRTAVWRAVDDIRMGNGVSGELRADLKERRIILTVHSAKRTQLLSTAPVFCEYAVDAGSCHFCFSSGSLSRLFVQPLKSYPIPQCKSINHNPHYVLQQLARLSITTPPATLARIKHL